MQIIIAGIVSAVSHTLTEGAGFTLDVEGEEIIVAGLTDDEVKEIQPYRGKLLKITIEDSEKR